MNRITIKGSKSVSELLVGARLDELPSFLPDKKVVVIIDRNVDAIYGHHFVDYPVIRIQPGEQNKTLETLAEIYRQLLDLEVDRSWFVLGVGGGIACDVTGYAASTYMRGLPFGFVSTTLLSQVDASLGGKNGINFEGYKNQIGTFNQPDFVLCDPAMLQTLPEKEVLSGFGEVVKHALIADAELFSFLETNYQKALRLEPETITHLVYRSVGIKSLIVNRDETEQGERRKLNFGHTLAHAIEKCSRLYTHGEAVGIGIAAASRISVDRGMLTVPEEKRILKLLKNLGLPVAADIGPDELTAAMLHDKKREGSKITLALLSAIGRCELVQLPVSETTALAGAMQLIQLNRV